MRLYVPCCPYAFDALLGWRRPFASAGFSDTMEDPYLKCGGKVARQHESVQSGQISSAVFRQSAVWIFHARLKPNSNRYPLSWAQLTAWLSLPEGTE